MKLKPAEEAVIIACYFTWKRRNRANSRKFGGSVPFNGGSQFEQASAAIKFHCSVRFESRMELLFVALFFVKGHSTVQHVLA